MSYIVELLHLFLFFYTLFKDLLLKYIIAKPIVMNGP